MLHVAGATVRFDGHAALDDVDLELGAGETLAILGPSGSGKSTLLRVIAGLQALEAGHVRWEETDLTNAPPHRREFGLMFQEYALFPHRDVRGNVEFGLRMRGVDGADRVSRVDEILSLVGLREFADRRVSSLSGGEQQRVALARALVVAPRLLMLDEPLGALDRMWRSQLRDDIRSLLRAQGIPSIWVTHDHEEAFAIGSRIAIMRAGRIVQNGTPTGVWQRPVDVWTARFLGFGPTTAGAVTNGVARTPWGDLLAPEGSPSGEVTVVLRPGAAVFDDAGPIKGVVTDVTFEGVTVATNVRLADGALVDVRQPVAAAPPVGSAVRLHVESDGVLAYPPD